MDLKNYHLFNLSILHCGTGQSLGSIDQPIARDTATQLPLVPSSSVRGVLRDAITDERGKELAELLFGPLNISTNLDSFSGALSIGDAHLLVLPVRAMQGVVAYATCPFILKRYRRDLALTIDIPNPEENIALHTEGNCNKVQKPKHLIILEDLDLNPKHDQEADRWAELIGNTVFSDDAEAKNDFFKRFLILPDAVFVYLSQTATEVRTRIRIQPETGVVDDGALWTEENLPSESIFWGVYAIADSHKKDDETKAEQLAENIPQKTLLQIGGNAGIGCGLVQAYFDCEVR